jgi:hypothetical protein
VCCTAPEHVAQRARLSSMRRSFLRISLRSTPSTAPLGLKEKMTVCWCVCSLQGAWLARQAAHLSCGVYTIRLNFWCDLVWTKLKQPACSAASTSRCRWYAPARLRLETRGAARGTQHA